MAEAKTINFNNLLEIAPGTLARTIILFIALINIVCILFGFTPLNIDENQIYEVISGLAVVIASLLAWWKNNSFTQSALQADALMDNLKKQRQLASLQADILVNELKRKQQLAELQANIASDQIKKQQALTQEQVEELLEKIVN